MVDVSQSKMDSGEELDFQYVDEPPSGDEWMDDPHPFDKSTEPSIDSTPEQVAELDDRFYTLGMRKPEDVVLSGPIFNGWGPGRYFQSRRLAREWCQEKYGIERVGFVRVTSGRWAYLIRGLKCQTMI